MGAYPRLALLVAATTIVMYALMYFNAYNADHIWFSQTRAWMAVMMGAAMMAIMLGFMRRMYPDRSLNLMLCAACA